MASVNVYEAKTHLSRLLRRVKSGEEIVIAEAGKPVARLVPIEPAGSTRVLGGDEDTVVLVDDFDAPLPAELIDAFYGKKRKPQPKRQPAPSRTGSSRRRTTKKA